MKAFKHPNVVELIGMCLDSPDGFPLMISPFYPNGNLKTYLQKSRGCSLMVTTLPEVILEKHLSACMFNGSNQNVVNCASCKIGLVSIKVTVLCCVCCVCMCVCVCVCVCFKLISFICSGYIHIYFNRNVFGYCTRNNVYDRKGICSRRPCCTKLHVSP